MLSSHPSSSHAPAAAGSRMNLAVGVALAVFLGVVFIAGAGFAGSEVLHNAAHDGRHVLAFPCH